MTTGLVLKKTLAHTLCDVWIRVSEMHLHLDPHTFFSIGVYCNIEIVYCNNTKYESISVSPKNITISHMS